MRRVWLKGRHESHLKHAVVVIAHETAAGGGVHVVVDGRVAGVDLDVGIGIPSQASGDRSGLTAENVLVVHIGNAVTHQELKGTLFTVGQDFSELATVWSYG